jgi:hypothetical protein
MIGRTLLSWAAEKGYEGIGKRRRLENTSLDTKESLQEGLFEATEKKHDGIVKAASL